MKICNVRSVGFIVAAMLVMFTPGRASADWILTPFVGTPFGGDADRAHFTWGGGIGYLGARIVGFEFDFGRTEEFFEPGDPELGDISDSTVASMMGNLIVAAPMGYDAWRPYATTGVGWLRTRVNSDRPLIASDNTGFGFNVGGGLMGFVSEHVGLRGDVRYFRQFEDPEADTEFDVGVGDFDFWRGTVGVTFRF